MSATILIVEDDADLSAIYTDALQRRGYKALLASNGAEGVHLARRHLPQLIILDLRMPIMDGWGALEYLRSDSTTRRIPVIILSAYVDARPLPSGGGIFALTKPVQLEDLLEKIESVAGKPTALG